MHRVAELHNLAGRALRGAPGVASKQRPVGLGSNLCDHLRLPALGHGAALRFGVNPSTATGPFPRLSDQLYPVRIQRSYRSFSTDVRRIGCMQDRAPPTMTGQPPTIAIEGPCCAGKTTLASGLVEESSFSIAYVRDYSDHVGGGSFLPPPVPMSLAEEELILNQFLTIEADRTTCARKTTFRSDLTIIDRSVHTLLAHCLVFSSMRASTPVCGPISNGWPGYRVLVSSGWMRRSTLPWSAHLPQPSSDK